MIVIVDYGMGNLRSVENKLGRCAGGCPVMVSGDPAVIRDAERLVLPGVGSFATGMRNLAERQLIEPLTERVLGDGVPILGICLGFQLFGRHGEEGDAAGLGWIDATCRRFRFPPGQEQRVPHVGWNLIQPRRESALLTELADPPGPARFYFTHSYHLECQDPADVVAVTSYGVDFPAAIERGNILGVQFHPEKSHAAGLRLLRNFAGLPSRVDQT